MSSESSDAGKVAALREQLIYNTAQSRLLAIELPTKLGNEARIQVQILDPNDDPIVAQAAVNILNKINSTAGVRLASGGRDISMATSASKELKKQLVEWGLPKDLPPL